jgi:putative transposase
MNEMSGWYIASESSFYRVLTEQNENHRRGSRQLRSSRPATPSRSDQAESGLVLGRYLTQNDHSGSIFLSVLHARHLQSQNRGSRNVDAENAVNSEIVLRKALLRQGCVNMPPVVHSGNGSAMKGGTLPATFE